MRYYYDYSFPIGNLTIEEDGHVQNLLMENHFHLSVS